MKIIDIIQERDEIIRKYCTEKGWDMNNLSFEQILKIRQLPEWQSATEWITWNNNNDPQNP